MKIGKEIFTVLPEKPSIPPQAGYIFVYSWKDKLWYMDSFGQEYLLPGAGGLLNQLITGGYSWVSGLTFDVSACLYLIQGTSYESEPDTIILDAAHETLDRTDVIYLDIAGLVGKITGVAGSGAKPLVDPLTQLELTSVNVPAGGTEPGGISNGYIYQENIEWTTSANSITGVGVNFASTTNPSTGIKCIEVKRTGTLGVNGWKGQYLKFVRPSGTESILNSAFVLSIRNAKSWRRGDQIEITLALGTGIISAAKVIIKDGAYGFNSGTTTYQKLVIPIADFQPISFNIDTVYITFNGAFTSPDNVVGFDDIFIQAGNTPPTGHDRLHEMTSPLDHKPVAAAFYNKIVHTNAVTGAWELIDMPTGTASAYVYIAYASDDQGTDFSLTPSETLDYIAIKSTTEPIASPQASDFTGLWQKYKGDDGAPGAPGSPGAPGAPGDDAYVYIAYASSDAGAGFTMTFDAALDYVAILATTTAIPSPEADDFAGLWKYYGGASYTQWHFNVDADTGLVETPITDGEKIYFKRGKGISYTRTTHETLGNVFEIEATGLLTLPADGVADGVKITLTASGTQAVGDVCFINGDGKAQLGNATAIATASACVICLAAVTANNEAQYLVLGTLTKAAWTWTPGGLIYLATAGTSGNTITQTAPTGTADFVIQVLGRALTADTILFNPSLSQVEYKV